MSSWDWLCQFGTNHRGDSFDGAGFSYLKGICDAWDDPRVRRVFFRACSRVGKTEINLGLHVYSQCHDPDVGLIATPTERLLQKTIKHRLWPMLSFNPATGKSLPGRHLQAATKCRTDRFVTHGAWSHSPTTLGDLDPKYLHLLEVSKFSTDNSDEANAVDLVLQRGSEIPDRKVFAESTPTLAGSCEISRLVEQATNRSLFVPCPRCGEYSALTVNESHEKLAGGLWWDRKRDGSSSPGLAYRTARYICPHCSSEWGDRERLAQVRRGVWVAPGESIDRSGALTGTPINAGPDESFNLNRMYAPTFTFADYAREHAAKVGTEREQDFRNSWQGVPHTPIQARTTWSKLAAKLCTGKWDRGAVPKQCVFLTCAVDVQLDHFVCTTFGWDSQKTGYLVEFGTVNDWLDVREWLQRSYRHEDGGPDIRAMMTTIDAKDGNRKDEVIDNCRVMNSCRGPFVWPSMGQNPKTFTGSFFQRTNIDASNNIGQSARGRTVEGLNLIRVGTRLSQEWLDNCLFRRAAGEANSLLFPDWARESQSLFDQLINECFDVKSGLWKHIDSTTPVDFRDAVRYARVAAEAYVGGDWAMNVRPRRVPQSSQASPSQKTPDGVEGLAAFADRVSKRRSLGKRFIRRTVNCL
ncbi:terminase gpA endonuclease subunit [Roseiconus lacunae]|uniref:terminase gpA endonuclease subunit n=1 Tax=Roseiconus lacunae TaxID=2605694 RepID=UPI0030929587|nr:terminase gpA endonuclease subunit [Stieleria sp. HD01]